jgi:hypothetical protein
MKKLQLLLIMVVFALTATPALATPRLGRPRPPRTMVKSYMAREAISENTAQKRLELQGRAWDLVGRMTHDLGARYGGT